MSPVRRTARAATRRGIALPSTHESLGRYVGPDMLPRVFMQFSDVEKLGVFPKSSYSTPSGIYAYPLTITTRRKFEVGTLPFAQDRSLVIVFRVKDPRGLIYTSQDITESRYRRYLNVLYRDERLYDDTWMQPPSEIQGRLDPVTDERLRKYLIRSFNKTYFQTDPATFAYRLADALWLYGDLDIRQPTSESATQALIRVLQGEIIEVLETSTKFAEVASAIAASNMPRPLDAAGRYWWWEQYLTLPPDWPTDVDPRGYIEEWIDEFHTKIEELLIQMRLSAEVSFEPWAQQARIDELFVGRLWNVTRELARHPKIWTSILRDTLEIDGVVDDEGRGLIHDNEPIQAVFFGASILEVLDVLPNEYTPTKISRRRSAVWSRAKDLSLSPYITEDED